MAELPFSEEEFQRKNARRLNLLENNLNGMLLTTAEEEELHQLEREMDDWLAARYPLNWAELERLEKLLEKLAGGGGG